MIKERILTADFLLSQGFSLTIVDRFWAKVDRNGPVPEHRPELGPCWIWTAATVGKGYGVIGRGKAGAGMILAHVLSWILANGPVPADKSCICHHCDTPLCIRPSHLFPGTLAENNRDMAEKRRNAFGERTPNHKLTWIAVEQIRQLHPLTGTEPLAAFYRVAPRTIRDAANGTTWNKLLHA